MPGSAQILLLVEGAGFLLASLVHRGLLVAGYQHHRAAVAEKVIGVELLLGLVLTWLAPGWRRPVARGARP